MVLLYEPFAAPFVDGGSCDAELGRDLTGREHAAAAEPLMTAWQIVRHTDEG